MNIKTGAADKQIDEGNVLVYVEGQEEPLSIPIVKGHETIDLDVTEPQMQDAVKTMQMSADAAVAHIRGNIEDDTTLIIINALDSRATVKKAAESKAKNLIEQEESKGDA